MTVVARCGLSTSAGGIVVTGHVGVSSGFTSSPSRPAPGRTVSFNALFSTMSAQPVLVNFWAFGDGSVSAGSNPSHTYANSGTFVVKLVQFSGVGSAFPGAGAGPIETRTITVGGGD